MADLSLYFDIIKTFEDLNVPYVIIEAYAAAVFGSTRVTYDIDIIVDLNEHHIKVIALGNETVEFWNKLKKW